MNIINICGAAICAALMILVVKEIHREQAFFITLTVGILFIGFAVLRLTDLVDYIKCIAEANPNKTYIAVLLKALGIAYITEITHEICKASGETAISGYVEAVGKAEIIVLCIPMLKELTAMALKYI